MNKTLLLIVCDFLLISLLALVKVDDVQDAEKNITPEPDIITDAGPQQDMIDALQSSLDQEQEEREAIWNRQVTAVNNLLVDLREVVGNGDT